MNEGNINKWVKLRDRIDQILYKNYQQQTKAMQILIIDLLEEMLK